jgi:hypothetical protein
LGERILFGAFPADSADPGAFEAAVGRQVSLLHTGQSWVRGHRPDGTYAYQPFSAIQPLLERQWRRGTLVLVDWRPWDLENQTDPTFNLPAVLDGRHDAYLEAWASAAAAYAHPFLLKPWAECNGGWYVYGEGVGANQPGQIVAAWRHVHAIFTQAGASNVTWCECFNIMSADPSQPTARPPAALYPGDEYVDWLFMDGYNFGPPSYPWHSFEQVFRGVTAGSRLYQDTYAHLAALSERPIGIAEVGCPAGPGRGDWIRDMFAAIPSRMPRLRALCWTDASFGPGDRWPISAPPDDAAIAAFRAGLADPRYVAGGALALPPDGLPVR